MEAHLRIEAKPLIDTADPHGPVTTPEVCIWVIDDQGAKHMLNGVTKLTWCCNGYNEPDFTRCTLEMEGVEFDGELPLDTVFLVGSKITPAPMVDTGPG